MNGESRSRFFAEKFMKLGYMAMFAGYADNSFLIIQKGMFKWADEIVLLDKYWNKDNAMQYCLLDDMLRRHRMLLSYKQDP